MLSGVVFFFDFVEVDDSVFVGVQNVERLLYQIFSEIVHFSSDCTNEFIVVDFPVVGSVKRDKGGFQLGFVEAETKVASAFLELVEV